MGQRFQLYVNYGKGEGENLFALHLQWCWGPYAIIRAHQLTEFLDGAREYRFNPFGLGDCSTVGGASFDGRREDLYLLRALSEINPLSCSIVEGHDLMAEQNEWDIQRLANGEIPSFPTSITIDPLAQDNNDGFLVVKATEDEIRYAFCRCVDDLEPLCASDYLIPYEEDMAQFDQKDRETLADMTHDLNRRPLLTMEEMTAIFERSYNKELNIEGFQMPEQAPNRHEPLNEIVKAAKERAHASKPVALSESPPQSRPPHPSRSPDR